MGVQRVRTTSWRVLKMLALTQLLFTVLAVGWLACPPIAKADIAFRSQTPTQEDFNVVVDYFSRFVYEVDQPFYLYHWRIDPSLVQSEDARLSPQKYGHRIIEREATGFIAGLYVQGRIKGAMYGRGLYTAVDAVITEEYGGQNLDQWALLTMSIPMGFQLLDPRFSSSIPTDAQLDLIKRAFYKFHCPANHPFDSSIDKLLRADLLNKDCADMIKNVLSELHIDGFAYDFMATQYKACTAKADRSVAIILTASEWLKLPGADARLYTARTLVDLPQRRAIESQFFSSPSFPKRFTVSEDLGPDQLHWADLLSQNTEPDFNSWLKHNLMNCGSSPLKPKYSH